MEQHLGRKLSANEIVHHINGDIHDNRLENMEVMSRSEHAKHHLTGITLSEERKQMNSVALSGRPNVLLRTVSDEQIRKALKMYGDGERKIKIEQECGFSMATIYKMFKGQYVRHREFKNEINDALTKRNQTI